MGDDQQYRAEYAKSGRAGCKGCQKNIEKDSLRLAVMVQSPFFDGKQPRWHHFHCFFSRCRPKDVDEIGHYQSLRWEDQEKIKKKIESFASAALPSTTKGKGKRKNSSAGFQDYSIGYAKSGKSTCKVCEKYIAKNDLRISKKDFESDRALQFGPLERWHHVECFIKVRGELQFFASGSCLPGFKSLSPDDQRIINSTILEQKQKDDVDGPSPPKKVKQNVPNDIKKKMKSQNDLLFKYRDKLEELEKPELILLLQYNDQEVPEGISSILDRVADGMAFGALKKCEKCKGQFVFQSGVGYRCLGYTSEWVRCENKVVKPPRITFKIPTELKESYKFLKTYKCEITDRLFVESAPKVDKEVKNEVVGLQHVTETSPIENLNFFIHKTNGISTDDLKLKIKSLGGNLATKFGENISAVISTEDELKKNKLVKVLQSSKNSNIPILSAAFFHDLSRSTSRDECIRSFKENKISDWGMDAENIIIEKKITVAKKSSYPKKSEMFKSQVSVQKVTLKDGLAVDPDSELDKVAHVYRSGKDIYSTVLSLTDVQTNKNSFYKLQILEGDNKKKYWLFRSWGRIGTTIGGNKVDKFSSLTDCIDLFKQLFEEKTGNVWELRHNFQKIPGKMMILEVNYKEKNNDMVKTEPISSSLTLHKSVQELINLIFDVEAMRKTMMEFELDLTKMPLGKISRAQIQNAFTILAELQDIIKAPDNKTLITDRTNKFYTLVPHDCGVMVPPLLNNEHLIQQKIEILHNLMEIEIAYNLLQECQESNSIDDYYKKLNADIVVVEHDSEEFKIIETYVKNTHAKTHQNYSLEIEEVFKINRKGEAKQFKKFSKLPNRKLLWHGSRVTNFAGILSQGLRIAPPEAPSTGYMFGKGIYFADRVSKSANYCMTSKKNPTGLILLCEVALGEMYELTSSEYVEKLPAGKHSVKGLGKTIPDPKEVAYSPTGAEVPLGSSMEAKIQNTSLLYNEYIVYDVSQVKIEYLLRLNFKHKM